MALRVRADFASRACVAARDHQWVASPEPGVERVMLRRLTPRSDVGCSLFVKLRQFAPDDLEQKVIDIETLDSRVADGTTKAHPVRRHGVEEVWILDGGIGAAHEFARIPELRELLVLSGNVVVNGAPMTRLDWLRLPAQPMRVTFTTAIATAA